MICPRCTKQTDGIHTCTPTDGWRRLEKQRYELLAALDLYEQALQASWPEGALGDVFDYWNSARAASEIGKESK